MNPENSVKDKLSRIHAKACDIILDKLEHHPEEVTAADINAIRGLLKDSGITALPVEGSPFGKLVDATERVSFPFAVDSILPDDDPAVTANKKRSIG